MGCRTADIGDDCTTSQSYQLRHDNCLLPHRCQRCRCSRRRPNAWPRAHGGAGFRERGVPIEVPTAERPANRGVATLLAIPRMAKRKNGRGKKLLALHSVAKQPFRCGQPCLRSPCRDRENAPREIRTPTVQTDHKALNLARDLPDPSGWRRFAHLCRAAGRSGLGGRDACCHRVVTATVATPTGPARPRYGSAPAWGSPSSGQ
jgi:hypothetical protein